MAVSSEEMGSVVQYRAFTGGHAPGHLREAFCEWLDGPEAEDVWIDGEAWPLGRLFGQLWNCTDILPRVASLKVQEFLNVQLRSTTYAAAVRRLKSELFYSPSDLDIDADDMELVEQSKVQ